MDIVIDKQFSRQLFPLADAEYAELEQSIIAEGCRDSLVVWNGLLVDGHNRYEICKRYSIAYGTREIHLASRGEAEDWIDRNQAGRRNLSPSDFAIISGRIYNRRKKAANDGGKGTPKTTVHQVDERLSTAEEVGKELGVSKATIERNGQRAEVFDRMRGLGDEEAAIAAKAVPQSVIAEVKSHAPEQAAEELKKHVHVSANSGEQDWYTPSEILDAARSVLGVIDVDPASSDVAQTNVRAAKYFTAETNGLEQEWRGRVWMNPPYSARLVSAFAAKLVEELDAGRTVEAIVLVNNATETGWFQTLLERCRCVCFPKSRVKFLDSTLTPKNSPLQGQAVLYFGDSCEAFKDSFLSFGICLTKM